MIEDEVSYSKFDHVFETALEGRTTLLDYSSGVYFGLDDVGTFVWNYLNGNYTVIEISEAVAVAYNIDIYKAKQDVLAFLDELLSLKLIQS